MQSFKRTVVQPPTLEAFREALPDYEVMIVTILDCILDRYERDEDYHFIDTKLNIITGEDFPVLDDAAVDFKSKAAVFGWIQGRGLESLVGHARWLERCTVLSQEEKENRLIRLGRMIGEVFRRMEVIRAKNGGRVSFMMTPDGDPFDLDETGRRRMISLEDRPFGFADLFYAKGMLAAAAFLGLERKTDEAKEYFRRVLAEVRDERFESDAVSFNPRNPSRSVEGQFAHGPRMIAIGGCALFAELTGEDEWFEAGAAIIDELMRTHLNLGQFDGLEVGDYFEHRDADGNPFVEDDHIISDPGHALEFVGLSAKLLLLLKDRSETRGTAAPPGARGAPSESEGPPAVRQRSTHSRGSRRVGMPHHEALLQNCTDVFPQVFLRNFANGFNAEIGGIRKAVDLVSRLPVSEEMPWWNLPETMRSAALVLKVCPESDRLGEVTKAMVDCSNGFMTRFVNPDVHLMAYQTVGPDGKPVDAIPATPDADPGYHTSLSLIDMLDSLLKA